MNAKQLYTSKQLNSTIQSNKIGGVFVEDLYNSAQIAERYGVEIETVWSWIRKKQLVAMKLGREYRIKNLI